MEQKIQDFMAVFEAQGFQIYIVGGYVRDSLMKRISNDIDFTSNATPDEIERLFPQTSEIGKKFGTIGVYFLEQWFEVTTFRYEQAYINHRKPVSVTYGQSLQDDVQRRDFTINGLAMDRCGNIYDYVNGNIDIDAHVIRTIGNPNTRFEEDAIRILRGIRFACRFQFEIEKQTMIAMSQSAHLLQYVSTERIKKEWENIFQHSFTILDEQMIQNVGRSCFRDGWKHIFKAKEYSVTPTGIFALLSLMTMQDWKYTREEKRLAKRIKQTSQKAQSIRYLNCTRSEAIELGILVGIYLQEEIHIQEISNVYDTYYVYTLKELAISADDCKQVGFHGYMIAQALQECAQAINTGALVNERGACLLYVEEGRYE